MSNHNILPQCGYGNCTRQATRQPFAVEVVLEPLADVSHAGETVARLVVAYCSWHADVWPVDPPVSARARRLTIVS